MQHDKLVNESAKIFSTILAEIDIERERDEFGRHGDTEEEMRAAEKGYTTTIKSLVGVDNSDAPDIKKGELEKVIRIAKKAGKSKSDIRRVFNQVRSGTDEPSIIRTSGEGKKKKRKLVAGNTRAMVRAALGKPQKVHIYKAPKK